MSVVFWLIKISVITFGTEKRQLGFSERQPADKFGKKRFVLLTSSTEILNQLKKQPNTLTYNYNNLPFSSLEPTILLVSTKHVSMLSAD